MIVLFGGEARGARARAEVRIGRVVKTFTPDGTAQRDRFEDVTVDSSGLSVAIGIGGRANPQAGGRPASPGGPGLGPSARGAGAPPTRRALGAYAPLDVAALLALGAPYSF